MMRVLEILMVIVFYYIFINPVLIYMIITFPMFTTGVMMVIILIMVISLFKGLITKKQ